MRQRYVADEDGDYAGDVGGDGDGDGDDDEDDDDDDDDDDDVYDAGGDDDDGDVSLGVIWTRGRFAETPFRERSISNLFRP